MAYVTTLKSCLEYIGILFPTSLFEATFHAVDVGAVEARRGGVRYWHVLQELTACQPELLAWPAAIAMYDDMKQEQGGMIFLEGETDALFHFRTTPEIASHQGDQPSGMLGVTYAILGEDQR
jgi:hypothetical protein